VDVEADGVACTKTETMQHLAGQNLTDVSLSDLKVVWIDKDAAIVMGHAVAKGTSKDQPIPEGAVLSSTLWVIRNGKWLAKYHQEMPVAPQK
jgi:hypothetical protein